MQAIELVLNQRSYDVSGVELPNNFEAVYAFHKQLPGYAMTPLHTLEAMAGRLGVKGIYVKDESHRFGLNAFKGLGASYAVEEILKNAPEGVHTFVSCTDGNHGRALAWRAKQLRHKAEIFMPKGSEERRVKAIEAFDAKVVVTDMNYDDTVRYASEYANTNGYYLVQDTALPDYVDTPNNVVMGYTTMVHEALEQLSEKPTHVFVQAGVGSMAGGVTWYLHHKYGREMPFVSVIEASCVACIFESIKQSKMVAIGGTPYTAMAGLNCGEANPITFPILKALGHTFIKCEDEVTFKGMHLSKNPIGNDVIFSSGESGAVGIGLIDEIMQNPIYSEYKKMMQLDSNSVVLIFSTEGELIL